MKNIVRENIEETISERKRDKKDIKTLNSHLQEDTSTSHTLPSARLSMSRSAPLSPIMSMNRIVPVMENRSIALSMNKFELLIMSRKCKTVTNTNNKFNTSSIRNVMNETATSTEEKCSTVTEKINLTAM